MDVPNFHLTRTKRRLPQAQLKEDCLKHKDGKNNQKTIPYMHRSDNRFTMEREQNFQKKKRELYLNHV